MEGATSQNNAYTSDKGGDLSLHSDDEQGENNNFIRQQWNQHGHPHLHGDERQGLRFFQETMISFPGTFPKVC